MDTIITLITNHGLSIVISAIVLYGGYQLMNIYLNRLKKDDKNKNNPNSANTENKIKEEINTALERMLLITNSERIAIFELHNDINFETKKRLSITYEISHNTTNEQILDITNIPSSLFEKFITKIESENQVLLTPEKLNTEEGAIVHQLLVNKCTKRVLYHKITDPRKNFVGFIGLYKCDEEDFRDKDYELLKELCSEIGALLTFD